jgi:CheY-like chemotaxis protein
MTLASVLTELESKPTDLAVAEAEFQIVVVEDNEDDVLILCRTIASTRQNIRLHRALDGAEFFAALTDRRYPGGATGASWPPDLILVDLALPGTSGFDVIERVKAEPELWDVPVVVLSGTDDPKDQQRGLALGIHTHLRKPIRARELSWMVESIRKYRRRLQQISAARRGIGS